MKKLLAILMAALLILSLAACGEDNAKDRDSSSSEIEETAPKNETSSQPDDGSSKDDSSSKSDTGSSKKFATMEDYLNDPANVQYAENVKNSLGDTVDVSVYAEGSTIVYDYLYSTTYDSESAEMIKSAIEEALDASEDSFKSLAGVMQNDIEESVRLKVVYRNGDGSVLVERTYSP